MRSTRRRMRTKRCFRVPKCCQPPRCEHTLFVEDGRYQAGPSPVCVAWTDPEAARLTVTANDAAPQQLLLLTIVADTRDVECR